MPSGTPSPSLESILIGSGCPLAVREAFAVGNRERAEQLLTGAYAGQLSDPGRLLDDASPAVRLRWVRDHAGPDADLSALLGDCSGPAQLELLIEYAAAANRSERPIPAHVDRYLCDALCGHIEAADVEGLRELGEVPLRSSWRDQVRVASTRRRVALAWTGELTEPGGATDAMVLLRAGVEGPLRAAAVDRVLHASMMSSMREDTTVFDAALAVMTSLENGGFDRVVEMLELLKPKVTERRSTMRFWYAERVREELARCYWVDPGVAMVLAEFAADLEVDEVPWPTPGDAPRRTAELFAAARGADTAAHDQLVDELRTAGGTRRMVGDDARHAALRVVELLALNEAVADDHLVELLELRFDAQVRAAVLDGRAVSSAVTAALLSEGARAGTLDRVMARAANPAEVAELILASGANSAAMTFLVSEGLVSVDDVGRLPVKSVPRLGSPAAALVREWLAIELGEDASLWKVFAQLGQDFEGTLSELRSLVGAALAA